MTKKLHKQSRAFKYPPKNQNPKLVGSRKLPFPLKLPIFKFLASSLLILQDSLNHQVYQREFIFSIPQQHISHLHLSSNLILLPIFLASYLFILFILILLSLSGLIIKFAKGGGPFCSTTYMKSGALLANIYSKNADVRSIPYQSC